MPAALAPATEPKAPPLETPPVTTTTEEEEDAQLSADEKLARDVPLEISPVVLELADPHGPPNRCTGP